MTKRTPAAALPVFASVLFLALFITFATADVAVLEPKCVSNATDCTCSEHPGSGVCTQPLAGGKCLDGECSDSMRCDCLGFELCAINPCGRWEATPPAVRSLESEFQCSYVDGGAQCRTHTTFVDTVQGSTNAKDAAVVAVDELSVDERESTAVLSASFVYQSEALTIFRKLEAQPENQNELITDFELEDVKVDVAQTVLAVEEISVGKFSVHVQKKHMLPGLSLHVWHRVEYACTEMERLLTSVITRDCGALLPTFCFPLSPHSPQPGDRAYEARLRV